MEREDMTEEILTRLLSGEAVSGQTLSEELGVSRAAVWKQIGQLRELGFDIEACGGQGYRLVSVPDSLMAPVIARGLNTKWAGKPIIYLRSVDSTNRYARALARRRRRAGHARRCGRADGGARPPRAGLAFPGGRGHFHDADSAAAGASLACGAALFADGDGCGARDFPRL